MPDPILGVYIFTKMIEEAPTKVESELCSRKFYRRDWGAGSGYIKSVATVVEELQKNNIIIRVSPVGVDKNLSDYPLVILHYHTRNEREKAEWIIKNLVAPKLRAWFGHWI